MFDAKKPTAMLMGRFQPWHEGHLRLFQKALRLTGQVCIVIRTMPLDENNPYDLNQVKQKLQVNLHENGYRFFEHYIYADYISNELFAYDFINDELRIITLEPIGGEITSLIIHELKENTILLTTRNGFVIEVLLP